MSTNADPGSDRERLLSECLIFRALDARGRRELAARAVRATYKAGEVLFRVADPGRSMMVIAEGRIRVSLPTAKGGELVLAELERGAVLGEVSLLDGRPRTATATAVSPCTVLKLERPAIGPLLRSNPATCLAIVDLLCDRLRKSDERMAEIGYPAAEPALAYPVSLTA